MKLVEKLDQALDRVDLARPPPDQIVVLPRVIISCQKLKNVADQIGDLVIGIPFFSMDDSAVVTRLLPCNCLLGTSGSLKPHYQCICLL